MSCSEECPSRGSGKFDIKQPGRVEGAKNLKGRAADCSAPIFALGVESGEGRGGHFGKFAGVERSRRWRGGGAE